ncbi:signal peptidase II [Hoyosella altamirensis]|uniref:Lipoprotein signal peptidase n=1 Tax=Hoyosella altamirensis TaxID=616997 RepID=A0A839RP92_9ACTN|nr:signal peptidase II [Hoyosella altamirensis]MBB3038822.1 signal peptidase II [Hoyosella altamirensis]
MSHDETQPEIAHPKRLRLLFSVAVVVLALDLVTKSVAVALLEGREPVRLLGGAVYLVLYRNPGAAFSMATGMTWLLTIVAITVVVVIIRLSRNLRSLPWALGLGFVLGGALGNLVDRMFRAPGPMQGHVVDFVSLLAPDGSVWPVFNVADPAIVGGAIFLVALTFLGFDPDGQRHSKKEQVDEEGKR